MRAAISSTTTSRMVVSGKIQSSDKPVSAPSTL